MTFNFTTKIEDGNVIVFWDYELDDHGIYNSEVVSVLFNMVDIMPILSAETLCELDSRAEKVYLEQFND